MAETVTASYEQGVHGFTLPKDGELFVNNAAELRGHLVDAAQDPACSAVIVDISELKFIDNSGLSVLVGALKRNRMHNKPFVIDIANNPPIQKIFRITGLENVMQTITEYPDLPAET